MRRVEVKLVMECASSIRPLGSSTYGLCKMMLSIFCLEYTNSCHQYLRNNKDLYTMLNLESISLHFSFR